LRTSARCALTTGAAAALLAGCGGPQPPIGAVSPMAPASRYAFDAVSNHSYKIVYNFQPLPNAFAPTTGLTIVNGVFYGTAGGGSCYSVACGTVYELTPSGTEHVIYNFKGGTDGQAPVGNLLNVNGTLYGVTLQGGEKCDNSSSGCGTVFKISTRGDEHVIYRFKGGKDGDYPLAGLTSLNGMLYGTTDHGGGYYGLGTVFQITPTGREKVLYRFKGGLDGQFPQGPLIAFKGMLYGTTSFGGCYQCQGGHGTVFSIGTTGVERVVYAFQGAYSGDGDHPEAGLIAVKNALYGTTVEGGYTGRLCGSGSGSGCGTVFSVTPGGKERVLHQFKGSPDGATPDAALVAANGELFGTTATGGIGSKYYTGLGTVFQVTMSGDETIIHRFQGAPDGNRPFSNLTDLKGILYGTTNSGGSNCSNFSPPGCGTVFKFSP
jgi:uncharacterized repeat protein (TIGR03803 family)